MKLTFEILLFCLLFVGNNSVCQQTQDSLERLLQSATNDSARFYISELLFDNTINPETRLIHINKAIEIGKINNL